MILFLSPQAHVIHLLGHPDALAPVSVDSVSVAGEMVSCGEKKVWVSKPLLAWLRVCPYRELGTRGISLRLVFEG